MRVNQKYSGLVCPDESDTERERTEHKISLTTPQGQFLFHLPFPQARAASIAEVMESAGVDEEYSTEIQDIVDELVKLGVIEVR